MEAEQFAAWQAAQRPSSAPPVEVAPEASVLGIAAVDACIFWVWRGVAALARASGYAVYAAAGAVWSCVCAVAGAAWWCICGAARLAAHAVWQVLRAAGWCAYALASPVLPQWFLDNGFSALAYRLADLAHAVVEWVAHLLVKRLVRLAYFYGPSFLGYGGWGGKSARSICVELHPWLEANEWDGADGAARCTRVLERKFTQVYHFSAAVAGLLLLWRLLSWLWFRHMVLAPLKREMAESMRVLLEHSRVVRYSLAPPPGGAPTTAPAPRYGAPVTVVPADYPATNAALRAAPPPRDDATIAAEQPQQRSIVGGLGAWVNATAARVAAAGALRGGDLPPATRIVHLPPAVRRRRVSAPRHHYRPATPRRYETVTVQI